jgi:hypothetical protein
MLLEGRAAHRSVLQQAEGVEACHIHNQHYKALAQPEII